MTLVNSLEETESTNDASFLKLLENKETFNKGGKMEKQRDAGNVVKGSSEKTSEGSFASVERRKCSNEQRDDGDVLKNLNRNNTKPNDNLKDMEKDFKSLYIGKDDKVSPPQVKNGKQWSLVEQMTSNFNQLHLKSDKTGEQESGLSRKGFEKVLVPQKDDEPLGSTFETHRTEHELSVISGRLAKDGRDLNSENDELVTVEILPVPERIGEENEDVAETCILSSEGDYEGNRCVSFVSRGPPGGRAIGEQYSDIMNKTDDAGQPRKYVRPSPDSVARNSNRILSGGSVCVVNNSHTLPTEYSYMSQCVGYVGEDMYMTNVNQYPAYSCLPPGHEFDFANVSNVPFGQQMFSKSPPYLTNYRSNEHACLPPEYAFVPEHELDTFGNGLMDELLNGHTEELGSDPFYAAFCRSSEQGMKPSHERTQFYGSQIQPSSQESCMIREQLNMDLMGSPIFSQPSVLPYAYSPSSSSVLTCGDADNSDFSVLSPGQFSLPSPDSGMGTDIDDLGLAIEVIKGDLEESQMHAQYALENGRTPLADDSFGGIVPPVPLIIGSTTVSDTVVDAATARETGRKAAVKKPARAIPKNKRKPENYNQSNQPASSHDVAQQMNGKILPPIVPSAIGFVQPGVVLKQTAYADSPGCHLQRGYRAIKPKEPDSSPQNSAARKMPATAAPSSTAVTFSPPDITLPTQEPLAMTSDGDGHKVKNYRLVAGLTKEQLLKQDDDGDTILHLAIVKEEICLVKALLERYIREDLIDKVVNLANKQNQTPLCLAVFLNQTEVVKLLIERMADVNIQLQKKLNGGLKWYRLIHYAACRGQQWVPTLEEMLKSEKIDLHAFNSEGCTALHCAMESHGSKCQQGAEKLDSKATIYQLAIHGADLNIKHGLTGETPLHYAIKKKDSDLVGWFLNLIGYLQSTNGNTSPDLMLSILNAKTSALVTSLQLALDLPKDQPERIRILELLLRHGAEVSQKSSDGKLRHELARIPELAPLLKGGTSVQKFR